MGQRVKALSHFRHLDMTRQEHKFQIAAEIRKKAEMYASSLKYSNNVNPNTLGGLCAIASIALKKELKAAGYPAMVVRGLHKKGCGGHCWVECEGEILDVTATQYQIDAEPVLVTSSSDGNYVRVWHNPPAKEFLSWPKEQIPTYYHVNRLLKQGEIKDGNKQRFIKDSNKQLKETSSI